MACLPFNILQAEVVVLEKGLVGADDLEVPGQYDYRFPETCTKYLGECLRTNHFAAATPGS
jgi:hypothetical protein